MLMICWFYCIPFAKFLFFALSPILLIFAMFVLKRGTMNARRGLRQAAVFLMFAVAVKICLADIYFGKEYLLCETTLLGGLTGCDGKGFRMLQFSGLVLLVISSLALFQFYRAIMPEKKVKSISPEQVQLRFWANLSLTAVLMMMVWQLAPWVGFLTVGSVPGIFTAVPWQHLALVGLGLILTGFWKSESCVWSYEKSRKEKMSHVHNSWTPRDTLWTTVFLYLITLALSYVAHDVLTGHHPKPPV